MALFEAATRILTPAANTAWAPASVPLDIDPDGVLQEVINSGKYRFMEENAVAYSELVPDEGDGCVSFKHYSNSSS